MRKKPGYKALSKIGRTVKYGGVISPRSILQCVEKYTGISHRNITECNVSSSKTTAMIEQGIRNAINVIIGIQDPEDMYYININGLDNITITDVISIDKFCISEFNVHYEYLKGKYQ